MIDDEQTQKQKILILTYLAQNPGVNFAIINHHLLQERKPSWTTSTIIRMIKKYEQECLITRLPTDRSRLILSLRGEEYLQVKGVIINKNNKGKSNMSTQASFREILQDLGKYYDLSDRISHEEFTVIPILKPDVDLAVLGLLEAEKQGIAWIQEQEGSESVDRLQAINKGSTPILIPYLHQVEGGKQDRTIFEPIIIPVGHIETNPLSIPAKCIERSRWGYFSSRGAATTAKFKSAETKMAAQMAYVSSQTQNQSDVWETVGASAAALGYGFAEAPTSSYREIQEHAFMQKEDWKTLYQTLSTALKHPDQVGIVVAYGDKILGVEVFGSQNLWKQFSELSLKGFLSDKMFLQKLKIEGTLPVDIANQLKKEFTNVKISKDHATGAGHLYRFSKDRWQGLSLQYEGVPVHFYASKKHIDILKGHRRPSVQVQMAIPNI